jgi:hypothetical protein
MKSNKLDSGVLKCMCTFLYCHNGKHIALSSPCSPSTHKIKTKKWLCRLVKRRRILGYSNKAMEKLVNSPQEVI